MSDNNRSFQAAPRKKNALDHRKLNLSTPCPTAKGKYSNLIWGVHANNPRLTVYTGDPEDSSERTGYGRIAANLDTPTFYAFIELLERVARGTEECKYKIENKNYTWFGGKRSEVPVIVSNLWVGKDKDGAVWISITAENRPIIKFYINISDFHCMYHGDGNPFTKAEFTSLYAIAYCNLLRNMVSEILVNEYVEEAPKKPFDANKQNRGGGDSGNAKQQQPFGEDIPF